MKTPMKKPTYVLMHNFIVEAKRYSIGNHTLHIKRDIARMYALMIKLDTLAGRKSEMRADSARMTPEMWLPRVTPYITAYRIPSVKSLFISEIQPGVACG
jgi:hypothetical protein